MTKYLLIPKENARSRGVLNVSVPSLRMKTDFLTGQYRGLVERDPLLRDLHTLVGAFSERYWGVESALINVFGIDEIEKYPARARSDKPIELDFLEFPGLSVIDLPDEAAIDLVGKVSPNFHVLDLSLTFSLFQPFVRKKVKSELAEEDFWHLQRVNLSSAREKGFLGTGKDVRVAVLDTGVNAEHGELSGRVAKPYSRIGLPQAKGQDYYGHGTMVSSLICGKSLGVAPDAEIVDLAMMTRDNASAQMEDFMMGVIIAAKTEQVKILNISGGLSYDDQQFSGLLTHFPELIYVVAAGNDGPDKVLCPGSINNVVTVGAIERNDKVWKKSGGKYINMDHIAEPYYVPDLVAPGVDVTVAERGGRYKVASGTSLATPIVTGVLAALVETFEEKYDRYSNTDVIETLFEHCQNLGEPPERQGKGLLVL